MKTAVIVYEDRSQIGRGQQFIVDGFPPGCIVGVFKYIGKHVADKDVGVNVDGRNPIFTGFVQQQELIIHHELPQGKVLFLRIRSPKHEDHCQDVVLNGGVKVVTVYLIEKLYD